MNLNTTDIIVLTISIIIIISLFISAISTAIDRAIYCKSMDGYNSWDKYCYIEDSNGNIKKFEMIKIHGEWKLI